MKKKLLLKIKILILFIILFIIAIFLYLIKSKIKFFYKKKVENNFKFNLNEEKKYNIPEPQVLQISEQSSKDNYINPEEKYLKNINKNKNVLNNDNKNIIIHKKWIFYGFNGIDYLEKIINKNKNEIEKLKKKFDQELENQNLKKQIQNEIEYICLKTFGETFYNDFKERKYLPDEIFGFYPYESYVERKKNQKTPQNLDNFIYNSFNFWQNWSNIVFFKKSKKSFLFNSLTIEQTKEKENNVFIIEYKGPKNLIQEDIDYYLGKINITFKNENNKQQKYNIYFNPVLNNISIYKEKFNHN
ncbi:hypothetical protein [Candidatus Phytoplasma oryzae]|nr:hypothetical protein PIE28_00790 [Candidatus Phytoplasma oryzae]